MLAIANMFVYALRYGVLNWITVFLSEKHHAEIGSGADMLFTADTAACIAIYWLMPAGTPMWVLILLVALIGGLIYGPVMLIGLQAIDLSPHNVAGTAAGFTGLIGYLSAALASSGVGVVVQHFGWNVTFILFLAFSVATVVLFGIVDRDEKALMESRG